jgi:nucleotide-binding universal stress UspA family protein
MHTEDQTMYHSALVALKPQGGNGALAEMAVGLAARHELQLSGVAVLDPSVVRPAEAVPLGAAAFKAQRDDMLKQQTLEKAQAVLDAFTRLCGEAGVACTTAIREGSLESQIPVAVQAADLLMVGHGGDTESCSEAREDVTNLDSMLKYSSRPCLVVPCRAPAVERIVVAYDGSLQAARALHDFALSGLWPEAAVRVISLAENATEATETAERGTAYLRLHGYAADARPLIGKYDPASKILAYVQEDEAGALVMGAYGKSRWREFVFGTVTRSILAAAMVPAFLSH